MPLNIPNALTWARILLIPLFLGVFYLPGSWMTMPERNLFATATFALAAATDWFDGYLARRLQQTSPFGAFLDPVADKLMVAAALIMLAELERISALVAFIIIGREITISALREWMAKLGESRSVAVSYIGKVKTAAQMTAIPLLLYHDPLAGVNVHFMGSILILLAVVLTLWSMVFYLKMAWPVLAGNGKVTQKS